MVRLASLQNVPLHNFKKIMNQKIHSHLIPLSNIITNPIIQQQAIQQAANVIIPMDALLTVLQFNQRPYY